MWKKIDLTATGFGTSLVDAGFARVSARRYLRVTNGDVVQRIELRPNRHGGEITCDLTIHPLWAREHLSLDVLEPGVWIRTLCERMGKPALTWYERSETGIQQVVDAIVTAGLPWFDGTATADGIVVSATEFLEPWRNEQQVHVELGHSYLRAGCLAEAQKIFDRKPSRVARYKTLAMWISNRNTEEISKLHSTWIASARAGLPLGVA
jgi:hypothetical protein